ncbi:hypothetical protein COO91_10419 (plasmid) [Nostoc flagelliforme CCNUN1]|uniref:Uncharacterized protein n=2 Tax=Nostoc flagelliforme TaxID=1306274 RepID=A0A2K8T919_9NOSO|nr:hypothetical protein COO91_10419 [Nostoc flagelliforme CCNUN1]
MSLFGVQESLLEFRLGYLGRYWFLAISASLLLSFLLSAPITIALIIKFGVDPFTFPGNVILCAIAAVIFGVILSLSQWLILRQSEITPRVFALINTVVGIIVYFLLVWINEGTLEWSQYGSVKGERGKGKGFEYILYPLPLTHSPDHKESEKCLSEPYWLDIPTQYGSVKGEREKGKGFEYILYPLPLTLSPDHKESEKCLSEPYWEWSGNPINGWKTALIFLAAGAITGAATP